MALPELSEQDRNWYILKGYEITESNYWRTFILNGHAHREDGPAMESTYGDRIYYRHGVWHREDGACSESSSGPRYWALNGKVMTEKEHRKAVQEMKIDVT